MKPKAESFVEQCLKWIAVVYLLPTRLELRAEA